MDEIILVKSAMILPEVETHLATQFKVHELWKTDIEESFIAKIRDRVRGVATEGWAPQSFIDSLPNLKIIASFGVGYEGVDVEHATKREITLIRPI